MKLLLTGASGFLGWHIIRQLQNRYEIHGWQQTGKSDAAFTYQVDMGDAAAVATAFRQLKPQVVIHAAAISGIPRCSADESFSRRVNIDASAQLAQLCADANIPFIFCSTDMVFAGREEPYGETDAVSPLNIYGAQKAEAEAAVLRTYPQACVVRLPLLLGWAPGKTAGVVPDLWQSWQQQQPARLFTNEFRSVVWAADVVRGLEIVLQKQLSGILHLGGTAAVSRCELGLAIAQVFEMNSLQIIETTHMALGLTNRPSRVALDSKLAINQGFQPLPYKAALHHIKAGNA
jgi:dTDP-4-dehydrorhamnose reductase